MESILLEDTIYGKYIIRRYNNPDSWECFDLLITVTYAYLRVSRQEFEKVGVDFPYISCCGFTRF